MFMLSPRSVKSPTGSSPAPRAKVPVKRVSSSISVSGSMSMAPPSRRHVAASSTFPSAFGSVVFGASMPTLVSSARRSKALVSMAPLSASGSPRVPPMLPSPSNPPNCSEYSPMSSCE
jgi:hypothetical protein